MNMGVDEPGHEDDVAEVTGPGIRIPGSGFDPDNATTLYRDDAVANRSLINRADPGRPVGGHATGDAGGCDRCRLPAAVRAG